MASKPQEIKELQASLLQEGSTWQAGSTELFLASEEEQLLRLGYVPGPGEPSLAERETLAAANLAAYQSMAASAIGAPAAFDWRNTGGRNFITGVRNQGGCGSCVAFGTTAVVEGMLRIRLGDPNYAVDLSEAHLFYCHARSQGRMCSGPNGGWWVPPALDAYKNIGVADEACYPYQGSDQNCTGLCADWASRVRKIAAWHSIGSIAAMKDWLSTRGPLAACFTVYADFFAYVSGVYRYVSGVVKGGHCVCCVGYDDTAGCWIMKNSWGPNFGEAGYFRIAYGQCGIDSTMWAVDDILGGAWQNNKRITGLWTIDQDRNAYVLVDGIGWKKIAADNDNIFFNLLTQLIAAKAGNRPINYYEDGGVIRQVYVL